MKIVKEDKILFSATHFIMEHAQKLAIRNGSDILRFEKIANVIGKIEQEKQEKVNGIFKKHDAANEQVNPSHENYNAEKFDKVNKDWQELINSPSTIERKELQLYTFDEFVDALPKKDGVVDMEAINITGLKYWLVKE